MLSGQLPAGKVAGRKAARLQCRTASAQARKEALPSNAGINLKCALTSGSHL